MTALVGQAVSPAKAHFRTPRSEPRVSKRCPRSDEEVSREKSAEKLAKGRPGGLRYLARAVIEEQLPLRALDLTRFALGVRTGLTAGALTVIDERDRVPSIPHLDADFRRPRAQCGENGVLS